MSDYIFDIDGTCADNTHRQHWLAGKPKNWNAYNKMMEHDEPIQHVIDVARALRRAGHRIIFCSGREGSPTLKQKTYEWIKKHVIDWNEEPILYMRADKDYRSDDIIKLELLDQIRQDGYNPVAAFDDRQRVVDAWRSVGIPCYQVAPGDF